MIADDTWLMSRMMLVIPLILSLTVHEWAHAWSAWMLGDDTGESQGRLTLNPLAHIDPVGSLLLPVLGIPFGWAKPVPFSPGRFARGVRLRVGILVVAAAGPLSNLCIALGCGFLLALLFALPGISSGVLLTVSPLLETMIFLNVVLAVFNTLPIPPLDGSHVADCLMPDRLRPLWERFCSLGPVALLAVILLPLFLGISVISWPMEATQFVLDQVVGPASS